MREYLRYVARAVSNFLHEFFSGIHIIPVIAIYFALGVLPSSNLGIIIYGTGPFTSESADFIILSLLLGPLGIAVSAALSAFVIGFFRFRKRLANELAQESERQRKWYGEEVKP